MSDLQTLRRRRASASISVPLLAALGASTLLAGCGRSDDADQDNTADTAVIDTFQSAAECVAGGRYDQETCDKLEADAKADYAAHAKHYSTLQECREDSDQCDDTPSIPPGGAHYNPSTGGFVYIHSYSPAYSGYSVARPAPSWFWSDAPQSKPVYRTQDGSFATFDGVRNLRMGEAMETPRASFTSVWRGAATSFSEPSFAYHPSPVSVRAGFGSSFHGFAIGE